jgi:hypothetical protein
MRAVALKNRSSRKSTSHNGEDAGSTLLNDKISARVTVYDLQTTEVSVAESHSIPNSGNSR